jgi:hypothetical protein
MKITQSEKGTLIEDGDVKILLNVRTKNFLKLFA